MKNNSLNLFTVNERLDLFLSRVDQLRNTQLMKKGLKPSFRISSRNTKNSSEVSSIEPNEDELRSFLTIYRKFISNDSPIFMRKILNICYLHLTDDQLKNDLIKVRHHWNNQFKSGFVNLHLNQKNYAPEEIMDLWINAVYFHDDLEKIKHLEGITPNVFFYTVVRQIFLSLIAETTRQIFYVGSTITYAMENKYFEFKKKIKFWRMPS